MAHSSPWRGLFGLALLLTALPFAGHAQSGSATLTGRLLDGATAQPVPGATVVLLRPDSTIATGAPTDANGQFQLTGAAPGSYRLRASAVGYAALRRPVTVGATEQNMGELRLRTLAAELGEVRVEGQQAVMIDGLDKKVINVAKDLTSVGGTAANVLQNIPSVQVDQNGQVSLRGTTNVTIWINGKPSGAASSGTEALSRIPASSIERVEVITNPSARYDAANSGGIINLILKKPKENGTNGSAALNVGTRDKLNGQFSLNRKQGRWNWFMEYSYSRETYHHRWDTQQATTLGERREWLDQRVRQQQTFTNHVARAGFDFAPADGHLLTFSAQPVVNRWAFNERMTVDLARADQPTLSYDGHNETELNIYSVDLAADYRRTWGAHPGRELTGSVLYTPSSGDQRLDQVVGGPFKRQLIDFGGPQLQGQIDYVRPLGEHGPRLEGGLKGLQRGFWGTYDAFVAPTTEPVSFVRDASRSLEYRYHDLVSAAYAQAAHEIGKFSWQAGLRAEHTHARAALADSGTIVQRDYLTLFPSATINQKLAENQELQLSYSRRINRPDISQLLPLTNYSDPRNVRVANPRLRPELVSAVELGHQLTQGGATLSTTAFWRHTTDVIQRFRGIDSSQVVTTPDGQRTAVTRTIFRNVGYNTTYGLETSLNQSLTKWWRLTAFVSGFRNNVAALTGIESQRANWAWSGRLNTTITLRSKLDLQLIGMYRSATITNQGRLAPMYGLDVALQHRLLNDRATLTLRVSDVFNTQVLDIDAFAPGLTMHQYWKRETRIGYLGFSYAFGDAKNKPQRRLNGGGGGGLG